MSVAELKTIGTGTDAMIAQAMEAMEAFRPLVAKVRECESLTVEANGIGKVSEARKGLKRLRIDIDKKREELNKGALTFQKTVNSVAKELTKPVEEVEDILQAREDEHEAKKEAERRAKFEAEEASRLAAEAARQEKKQAGVNQMIEAGVSVDWAAAELSDESFHVWFGVAVAEAKIRREKIEEEARIAREFEEQQRKEREELAAKMAEESKRQAEELRIRAAEMEKQRLADQAALAEQRKAMEAEREVLRQQQEELRKAALAKKKAEREAAEVARLEALKPEIEQASLFCDAVIASACKWFESHGEKKWTARAIVELQKAKRCILFQIENMVP